MSLSHLSPINVTVRSTKTNKNILITENQLIVGKIIVYELNGDEFSFRN